MSCGAGPGYALSVDREDVDALHFGDLTARGRARLAAGDAAGAARAADGGHGAVARRAVRRLAGRRVRRRRAAPAGRGPGRRGRGRARGPTGARPAQRRGAGAGAAGGRGAAAGGLVAPAHAGALPRWTPGATRWPPAAGSARLLAEELGADPGPALRAVEAAVLAQDPALGPVRAAGVRAHGRPGSVARHILRPRWSRAARTRAWPPTRRRTPRCSAAGSRLVAALVAGWSTPRCWWCRGRAGPASPRSSAPGWCRHWPTARCRAARLAAVVVSPGRRPVDTLAELTGESPPEAPGPAGLRPVRGAVGARDATRRNGPRSSTPCSGCSTTGSSSGASRWCAATTSGGWPSTQRLTERLGGAMVLVPPLTDPELREVVSEPAGAVGTDGRAGAARRRGGRRARAGRGAAAAVHGAGRHLGAAAGTGSPWPATWRPAASPAR